MLIVLAAEPMSQISLESDFKRQVPIAVRVAATPTLNPGR